MHHSDVDDLEKNEAWKDIVEVLNEVKSGLQNEDFQVLDPVKEAGAIARIQGKIDMINFVIAQPKAQRVEIDAELGKQTKERKEGKDA